MIEQYGDDTWKSYYISFIDFIEKQLEIDADLYRIDEIERIDLKILYDNLHENTLGFEEEVYNALQNKGDVALDLLIKEVLDKNLRELDLVNPNILFNSYIIDDTPTVNTIYLYILNSKDKRFKHNYTWLRRQHNRTYNITPIYEAAINSKYDISVLDLYLKKLGYVPDELLFGIIESEDFFYTDTIKRIITDPSISNERWMTFLKAVIKNKLYIYDQIEPVIELALQKGISPSTLISFLPKKEKSAKKELLKIIKYIKKLIKV